MGCCDCAPYLKLCQFHYSKKSNSVSVRTLNGHPYFWYAGTTMASYTLDPALTYFLCSLVLHVKFRLVPQDSVTTVGATLALFYHVKLVNFYLSTGIGPVGHFVLSPRYWLYCRHTKLPYNNPALYSSSLKTANPLPPSPENCGFYHKKKFPNGKMSLTAGPLATCSTGKCFNYNPRAC